MTEKDTRAILSFRGISKAFPGVQALNNVSFDVLPGCVHAIVGENGAGKSTLLKIINGLYKADKGEIYLNGKEFIAGGPSDALKAGISMIYQELNIIPDMTVLDNLYLGREKLSKSGIVDKKNMTKEAQGYFKEQGLYFDLDEKMRSLSIAQAQMLEIVKAISVNAKVILMDEPTSSLTENEVDFLFNKIQELKERGITVIYISHKMEEVFAISDHITVLRDGEHINTVPTKDTDVSQVIEMMVGRKMNEVYPKKTSTLGEVMFEVKNFNKKGVFKDINFSVRQGEILGIAGLIGAGRTEIARAIIALDSKDSGDIYIKGKKLTINTVNDSINHGIVLVPEDRRRQGLNLIASIRDNISLVSLKHVFKSAVLNIRGIEKLAKTQSKELQIKAPSLSTKVEKLSGGNQQKTVLGKWLAVEPAVLFLDEPTRGIDVGTKYEIYKLMHDICSQGNSIVLIDSDMEELIGMSDRVIVVCEGEIAGELQKEEINANSIMRLAAVGGQNEHKTA
ncbi:MAG: sugar ABC transporter ATP-binding protein [Eubacteriales bacterium]|nr:sugar ABC transporter ATP-binding protein [Eubacteriales bacterium]